MIAEENRGECFLEKKILNGSCHLSLALGSLHELYAPKWSMQASDQIRIILSTDYTITRIILWLRADVCASS